MLFLKNAKWPACGKGSYHYANPFSACVLAGCTLPAEWMLISGSTGACYAVMGPTLDYASSITDCAGQVKTA